MDLSRHDNSDFSRGVLARGVFFQMWVPRPSALRLALLRASGARVGRGVVLRVNVSFPGGSPSATTSGSARTPAFLSLADVTIESNVRISQRVYF